MYLDFYDNRPDTPRVPQSLTRLERILLAAVAYLVMLVIYLVTPASVWDPVKQVLQPDEAMRFVHLEPMIDRTAVPKKPAPASDMDRKSATPEPAPTPKNDDPLSRGNTPEKFVGGPPDKPQDSPQPAPATPAPGIAAKPQGGILSNALHNLQQFARSQSYDNPQGGATEPGADIEFDSKGVDFGPWLRRFRNQVYSNWIPFIPTAADYQQGDVVIQFDLHKDGRMTNLRIVRGSGHDPLDVVALNALKLSNPTIPLPTAFPDEVAPFTVTFRYILRD